MRVSLILILVNLVPRYDFMQACFVARIDHEEDPAVTRFREYLRIPSNYPHPDYESCVEWLKTQSHDIGLDFHRIDLDPPGSFAVWLTWNGSDPSLKSIVLNSHMDVVAVDTIKWDYDPFGAYKDENGNIFARGAVDMKSTTLAALESIRSLKKANFVPLRTIHISVLPDEEKGGKLGMGPFVGSEAFRNLSVGFDMDETAGSETNEMNIEYGQKSGCKFNFTARGKSEHGSNMPENTAGQRLQIVIDRLFAYRAEQYELMNQPGNTISDVTSLNLVGIGGGLGDNAIPDELWAIYDMRVRFSENWNLTDVENLLDSIVEEAGPEYVSYTFLSKPVDTGITIPDDTNVWWRTLQDGCQEMNVSCVPVFLWAATDGKYVRNLGTPVFGVNPFINSPRLAHQDNEYINEKNFLDGIRRYTTLIEKVASVPGDLHP